MLAAVMRPPDALPLENHEAETTIEGVLERIVFANEADGWSVLRLARPGRRAQVTAVGNVFGVQPGETLRLAGRWVSDKKWGEQFEVSSFRSIVPSSVDGIERYLGSGLIRGLGKSLAKRVVEKFGAATLEIIENFPKRLREVEGIGPKRYQQILESWQEQREIQRVMVFLQSHGISTAHAVRIFKTYGAEAEAVVSENPYRLAADVFGIGFRTADVIAGNLGIPKDSPRRIEAGLVHLLREAADRGHVYLPATDLETAAANLLEAPPEPVQAGLDELARAADVVLVPIGGGERAVYLASLHDAESGLAAALRSLLEAPSSLPAIDAPRAIAWFEAREELTLAAKQRSAITMALASKVSILTGGPGTGKTTLLQGITQILDRKQCRILLAAPTGRAARRLAEATGREARTVHRLLEFDPVRQRFARGPDHPLEADLLIVDEASMLDVALARSTVEAVPIAGQLLLVGDVDQLPSVGPGRVLADLIASGALPVVRLDEIFRQAAESRIVVNAHHIRRGEMPQLRNPNEAASSRANPEARGDFFFIERQEPEEVLETLIHLVADRIPKGFGFDPAQEIQVLSPMNRGPLGVHNLNALLQEQLNPSGQEIPFGGRRLRLGDKVMQLKNNYQLEVANGDLGRIVDYDLEEQEIAVSFDGRRVSYAATELDELTLAYACSIHKSQGSEYPCVVVPVHMQHAIMLQRNLVYTALTRAKRLAVLIGQGKALALAVRNQDTRRRFTRLAERLASN